MYRYQIYSNSCIKSFYYINYSKISNRKKKEILKWVLLLHCTVVDILKFLELMPQVIIFWTFNCYLFEEIILILIITYLCGFIMCQNLLFCFCFLNKRKKHLFGCIFSFSKLKILAFLIILNYWASKNLQFRNNYCIWIFWPVWNFLLDLLLIS